MNPFTESSLLARLAFATVDVLLVAALVWLVCAVARPRSARVRSLLWLLVPAKGLCSLLLGSPLVFGLPQLGAESGARLRGLMGTDVEAAAAAVRPSTEWVAEAPAALESPAPAIATPPFRPAAPAQRATVAPSGPEVGQVVLGLWALGALGFLALSARDRVRGARLVRRSTPGDSDWQRLAQRHAARFGVRAPSIRRTRDLESPALVGAFRPVILIPAWIEEAQSARWAIRHELMHVALRDPWAALVRELGRIAFFFHPAVWFAGRRWEEAAELACDHALVHAGDDSLDYAERLHALAERVCRRPDPALAHGLFAAKSRVGRRIEALVNSPIGRVGHARLSRSAVAAVALLFAATLSAGAGLVQWPAADDEFVITGRVVAHDGTPVARAQIVATYWDSHADLMRVAAMTQADDSGAFALSYGRDDLPNDPRRPDFHENVVICAQARGHAAQFCSYKQLETREGITLRLVEDVPLRGRLVDTDGHPIAGASVRGQTLAQTRERTLDTYVAALEGGTIPPLAREVFDQFLRFRQGTAPEALTDENGTFELHGVGTERLVGIEFVGGGAALGEARMLTRKLDEAILDSANAQSFEKVLNPGDLVVAERTRPVEGVVVDDATGEPLAGVGVYSYSIGQMFGMPVLDGAHKLRATTDADGRFRLLGFAKSAGNSVIFLPGDDQPYLVRVVRIADTDGMEPIELKVALHRGVWISGRVVDSATGAPVRARVTYYPHLLNEPVAEIEQFKDRQIDGGDGRVTTGPDGRFRIVGLPGRGLVGVEAPGEYYQGAGFDPSWGLNEDGAVLLYGSGGREPGPSWPTAMTMLDVPADAEVQDCTVTVVPGQTVHLEVVDAEGRPVEGYEVRGRWSSEVRTSDFAGSDLDVRQLGPDEVRLVSVRSADARAGALRRVRAADASAPAVLKLQPTATITGRVLDPDGVPLAQASIGLRFMPNWEITGIHGSTDDQGRFVVEGVIPGGDYRVSVETFGAITGITTVEAVAPGARVDVGEHRVEVLEP